MWVLFFSSSRDSILLTYDMRIRPDAVLVDFFFSFFCILDLFRDIVEMKKKRREEKREGKKKTKKKTISCLFNSEHIESSTHTICQTRPSLYTWQNYLQVFRHLIFHFLPSSSLSFLPLSTHDRAWMSRRECEFKMPSWFRLFLLVDICMPSQSFLCLLPW